MNFYILTLFPEAVSGYFDSSMLWRAKKEKKASFSIVNIRDFSKDKHKKTDGKPYGGGPGMVMSVSPIINAVSSIINKLKRRKTRISLGVVITSASGKQFDNAKAIKIVKKFTDVVIIAGHYEGIDDRVKGVIKAVLKESDIKSSVEEISIGPYVLTGGEAPALVIVDSIVRQIPGVLGNSESLEEKRVASSKTYTRPEVYEYKGKKYRVPKVLLTGHHKNIETWRSGKNRE